MKNQFIHIWKIENMSVSETNKLFKSPYFTIARKDMECEETVWHLSLTEENEKCQLWLHLVKSANENNQCNFSFKIITYSGDNIFSEDMRYTFKHKDSNCNFFKWQLPFGYIDILENAKKYLSNDCFAIHFSMWNNDLVDFDIAQMISSNKYGSQNEFVYRNHTCSFVWNIANFANKSYDCRCVYINRSQFTVHMSFSEEEDVRIEIRDSSRLEHGYDADCKFNLPNQELCDKKLRYVIRGFYRTFSFPSSLNRMNLIISRDVFLPNGVLSLRLKLKCKIKSYMESQINYDFDKDCFYNVAHDVESSLIALHSSWERLYNSKELADVTLQTREKSLVAHKLVLAAQSPVFSTMFQQNMQENKGGYVDIQEINYDTLEALIFYMYSGKVKVMNYEISKKLLAAADRYQVISLKKKCCTFLKSCFTVDTVCEILLISDLYCDEELKVSAAEFFVKNSKLIINLPEWKGIEENNSKLAIEMFRKLTFRKPYKFLW